MAFRPNFRSIFPFGLLTVLLASSAAAEPLSKKIEVDFFRDVSSRNLKGLATRSDGRLVAGPVLTELQGKSPADLLWCLESTPDTNRWWVGTGPDGQICEVTFNFDKSTYRTREVAKLDEPQVFALRRLADGSLLAGTSPKGGLYLVRDGKIVARVTLPVDSIFDLLLLPSAQSPTRSARVAPQALVATGNPARIYQVDLTAFAAAGVTAEKIADDKKLAERGITLFGEIRDRNIRRLARFPDGRVVAGSAPKGNVYVFSSDGGAPVILYEGREAEVTDLLPQPNGDLYATFVFAGSPADARITRPKPGAPPTADTSPELGGGPDRFSGRSSLVWFPANGFPENLVMRGNLAFYRVARHGDTLVVAGGDAGDVLGYDLQTRSSLTFAGSLAAQLNGLVAIDGASGRYLLLKNNAPGFALLDFAGTGPREAETRRLDLGVPSRLGALRFNRLRSVDSSQLEIVAKANFGSDEAEGWTPWVTLHENQGGWMAETLRGRYAKLRLRVSAAAASRDLKTVELDKAGLFYLPQNRRPILTDFRVATPNYGLIPAPEAPPSAAISLGQLLGRSGGNTPGGDPDDKRKGSFFNSQVVPQTGTQLVLWSVNDIDGDTVAFTFSIRREGETAWTDLAVATRDTYAQFGVSHLPEGVYFTRLTAMEQAPRPAAEQLTTTFETDDLIVDRTGPEILDASAVREDGLIRVSVRGKDALSLLEGAEFTFNHGLQELLEQPSDGIRDGREETFTLELPLAKAAGATSVEVVLYDAAGNSSVRRLSVDTK